jgi:predicted dehydrogenase
MNDKPAMTNAPNRIARRRFLKSAGTAALGASALGFPQIVPLRVLGAPGVPSAKDRITVANIGVGGMGNYHLGSMVKRMDKGQVNVAAVCDVNSKSLARAAETAGEQAKAYKDYRHILERKDIDAVIFGTPDHWHAVQTVHAAECGKHVYVEKPACCTIEEGKAMVAAAKKNKIAVQLGSQGRSEPECYQANLYIANGMIGRVRKVTCWHYESPSDDNPVPDTAPPPELDWDMWLGPLPWRPYNAHLCPGQFRWMMESGGGQIRDRGAHVMSNALWIMNADHTGPVSIEAKGTLPRKGVWDSAVTMEVVYEFKNPDWTLVWSQPGERIPYFDREKAKKLGIRDGYGAVYHGEKDKLILWVGDSQVFTEPKAVDFKKPPGGVDVYKSPGQYEDWFNGIKTGAKTIMNVEAGVATAFLCVLGNLSFLLGRKLQWDPRKQEIVGDDEARRLMSRPQRYPFVL